MSLADETNQTRPQPLRTDGERWCQINPTTPQLYGTNEHNVHCKIKPSGRWQPWLLWVIRIHPLWNMDVCVSVSAYRCVSLRVVCRPDRQLSASHSSCSLLWDTQYRAGICSVSPLNQWVEGNGGKKQQRASFPSSARVKQTGTSMLIGDLISGLILQLCTTEESNCLFLFFFFFLINSHYAVHWIHFLNPHIQINVSMGYHSSWEVKKGHLGLDPAFQSILTAPIVREGFE